MGLNKVYGYASLSRMSVTDIEYLIKRLILGQYIREEAILASRFNTYMALRLGKNANLLLGSGQSGARFKIPVLPSNSLGKEMKARIEDDAPEFSAECYQELFSLTVHLAGLRNIKTLVLTPLSALQEMSERLPTSREEFLEITGITDKWFRDVGPQYQEICQKYSMERRSSLEDSDKGPNAKRRKLSNSFIKK